MKENTPIRTIDLGDLAPCGVLHFEVSGAIRSANPFFCAQLGYTLQELLAMTFDQVLTVSSRIFHQTHFLPMLKLHGHAEEIFFCLRAKSQSAIPVLANARFLNEQQPPCIVCAFVPVHQRGRYEEEILAAKRKAEEALGNNAELQVSRLELQARLRELDQNLAAVERRNQELLRLGEILSHDLREPVRKIAAFAEIIAQENYERLTENGRMALARIDAAQSRITRLLRTLQEFLWVDSDPEPLAPINLEELIDSARRRVDGPLVLSVDELPTIEGYAAQLGVLFEFIFRSSRSRAGLNPVSVWITSCRVQENSFRQLADKYLYVDFLQITVSDDAPGFECHECDALFQLLRKQPDQATHPDLAICKKIVDNHRGFITLRSPTKRGATFTISLPVAATGSAGV